MAWSADRCEGFEHGEAQTPVITGGSPIANEIVNASIVTSSPRTGLRCVRCQPTGAAAGSFRIPYITFTSPRNVAVKFHFRVNTSMPGSDLVVAELYSGAGTREKLIVSADGTITLLGGDNTTSQSTASGVVTADTWVAIEWRCFINGTSGNRTHAWRVNGTAQTGFTDGSTSGTAHQAFRCGNGNTTGPAASIDYDDVVIYTSSQTTDEGAFPTNMQSDLEVRGHFINADGTHSIGTGTYQNSAAGSITNGTTDAWTYIEEFGNVSDYVTKTAGTEAIGTSHLRFEFESATDVGASGDDPIMPTVYIGSIESAGQAENQTVDFNYNTTTFTIQSGDIGSTSGAFRAVVCPNNGETGDESDVNAMFLRYGSTDPAPQPRLFGAMVQIAYIPVAVAVDIPPKPTIVNYATVRAAHI